MYIYIYICPPVGVCNYNMYVYNYAYACASILNIFAPWFIHAPHPNTTGLASVSAPLRWPAGRRRLATKKTHPEIGITIGKWLYLLVHGVCWDISIYFYICVKDRHIEWIVIGLTGSTYEGITGCSNVASWGFNGMWTGTMGKSWRWSGGRLQMCICFLP